MGRLCFTKKNKMSKPVSKIKQKLKQIKFRHLKKYLSANLSEDSRNCVHNEKVDGEGSEVVCVCGYEGSVHYSQICDFYYNKNLAKECGLFCPKKSKEVLKKEFFAFVDESSRGQLAKEFPDVTALLWVLDLFEGECEDIELEEHYNKIEELQLSNKELSAKLEKVMEDNLTLNGDLTALQAKLLSLENKEEEIIISPKKTSLLERLFGWFR